MDIKRDGNGPSVWHSPVRPPPLKHARQSGAVFLGPRWEKESSTALLGVSISGNGGRQLKNAFACKDIVILGDDMQMVGLCCKR